ncbi:hypothetical protein LCGC14_0861090 [marine sediment metagenome]|uniref:ParB/Sulfiredoxin domain-containing protein n=1 Tax=marine sediment metagenome TaxID=412755 RepID=A0A0F9PCE1_9ZZZZ
MEKSKIEEFEITKDNIDDFVSPEWQRFTRAKKIKAFEGAIEQGTFFGSLFTVNRLGNKFRIINGNHRIKSIKSKLKEKPIKVILEIFEGLSEDEEKEIFNKISIETPQTLDDYLYIYRNEIPFWKMVKEKFPVNISSYRFENSIRLKTIIDIYASSINDEVTFDIRAVDREKALSLSKKIDYRFYNLIYGFFEVYKETIGAPKGNSFFKPVILIPMANIYLKHESNVLLKSHERFTRENWKNLFRKIITDPALIQYSLLNTSREIMKEVREKILYVSLYRENRKVGLI